MNFIIIFTYIRFALILKQVSHKIRIQDKRFFYKLKNFKLKCHTFKGVAKVQ